MLHVDFSSPLAWSLPLTHSSWSLKDQWGISLGRHALSSVWLWSTVPPLLHEFSGIPTWTILYTKAWWIRHRSSILSSGCLVGLTFSLEGGRRCYAIMIKWLRELLPDSGKWVQLPPSTCFSLLAPSVVGSSEFDSVRFWCPQASLETTTCD